MTSHTKGPVISKLWYPASIETEIQPATQKVHLPGIMVPSLHRNWKMAATHKTQVPGGNGAQPPYELEDDQPHKRPMYLEVTVPIFQMNWKTTSHRRDPGTWRWWCQASRWTGKWPATETTQVPGGCGAQPPNELEDDQQHYCKFPAILKLWYLASIET